MKNYNKLLAILNLLLTDELNEENQCIMETEMFENRGYSKLHIALRKQERDEMHQPEWIMERILLSAGSSGKSRTNARKIRKTMPVRTNNDNKAGVYVQTLAGTITPISRLIDKYFVDFQLRKSKMAEERKDFVKLKQY